MPRFVVLGGYGGMGSVCVRDLFDTSEAEIVIAGRDLQKAKRFASSFKSKRVSAAQVDVTNVEQTARVLKGADVCVNAVQYYYNLHVMRACLRARTNYIDLGGLYHVTLKQLKLDKQFKKIRKIAILGCGSSPGTTNIMAEYGGRFFDRVTSVHFYFGGKDYTKYRQPFVIPYSADTLLDEFVMKPAVLEKGRQRLVEPLGGQSTELFPEPVGRMKCFRILHSEVATVPLLYKKKGVQTCDFKECFPEDFASKIKFLVDAGFASQKPLDVGGVKIKPRDLTVRVLSQWLPKPGTKINDLEFLVAELDGYKDGKRKVVKVVCKAVSNKKLNLPAGTWDTGVPLSIIAQMIARGDVKKKGAMGPGFCIPPKRYFDELKKRDIHVYLEEEEHLE